MIPPTITYLNDIYFGFGASAILPDLLCELGVRRPLLVTDRSLSVLGIPKRIGLGEAPVYSGVRTNPSERQVVEAAHRYRVERCDGMVAVGCGLRPGTDADGAAACECRHRDGCDIALRGDLLQYAVQPGRGCDCTGRAGTRLPPRCRRVS